MPFNKTHRRQNHNLLPLIAFGIMLASFWHHFGIMQLCLAELRTVAHGRVPNGLIVVIPVRQLVASCPESGNKVLA